MSVYTEKNQLCSFSFHFSGVLNLKVYCGWFSMGSERFKIK